MEHGGWLRKACLSNIFPLSENHLTRSLINDFRQFCLWRQVTKEFRGSLASVIFDMKMLSQKYRDGTSVIVSVTVMKVYSWQNVPVTMYSVRYIALENNTLHYFATGQESLSRVCIGHVTPQLRHENSRRERHSTFDRCRAARVA